MEPATVICVPASLAVSYTHLDVYKRQTKYSRSQYALLLPMESADDMAVLERRLSAAYESARTQAAAFLEFRGTVLEELYGCCLLYTSRCV